ncbi:MAG: PKD domain-containing protein [Candidatus Paceibacterota bacterium]|jgi:hypothetical protein
MRYFDKTFFRFTLGFLVIVAISLMIMYAASAYASGVEKIIFTTDPQSIKPDTLSGPITVQSQDAGGNPIQTPETLDIQFISTSPTGEFLGSTGNPATTYMSKNTANKTFYYKDSKEGTFIITVNIRGRDTGIELDTSQQIIVSSEASGNTDINNTGEVLGVSTNSSSGSGSGTTEKVSSLSAQLEILAGVDRTTSPGSPIWFQATIKKNTTGVSPELNWSFGDGNVGVGSLVSHTYKYAGDLVVVLSARAGDIFSVSRLKVKVSSSDITVSDMGEYLEILNKGNTEINLFNWKIENQGKGFVFQPNTIVLAKSSFKLDKSLLKMKGFDNSLGTCLKNATGEMVFAVAPVETINPTEISKNIQNIKNEALIIQSKIENKVVASVASFDKPQKETTAVSDPSSDMPQENVIYEVPKKTGVASRFFNFFVDLFR